MLINFNSVATGEWVWLGCGSMGWAGEQATNCNCAM